MVTQAIRNRLPRELRDIIYHHIYDLGTMIDLFGVIDYFATLPESKGRYVRFPKYMQPGSLDEFIRTEVMRAYYETVPCFYRFHPHNTAVLFSPTPFIIENALTQCAIRTLNLLGDLSPGATNYLDPNTLLADLAPLLHAYGRLSTTFRLNWCLRTCH